MGLEPTASGATIQRSNQLSYVRHIFITEVIIAHMWQKTKCWRHWFGAQAVELLEVGVRGELDAGGLCTMGSMIVDLSIPIRQNMPVYPGDPEVIVELADTFEQSGYEGHNVTIGTHAGTHIDAPLHMIEGGDDLSAFPLETFVGRGKLVEGFSLEALQAAGVQAGDIVLFRSGASVRFEEESYFTDYPVLDAATVEALVAAKVKLVGIDTCSADNEEGFPNHKALLGAGIPIIENVTNLQVLQDKQFRVYALPLSLAQDAAPARVVAEVVGA